MRGEEILVVALVDGADVFAHLFKSQQKAPNWPNRLLASVGQPDTRSAAPG